MNLKIKLKEVNSMKKLLRFLTSFLITFVVIFTITFLTKLIIDAVIFSQRSVIYKNITFLVPIVGLSSVILTLFFQLNKVTILIQTIVTYLVMILTIFAFGVISGWFNFDRKTFSGIVLGFNIVGFSIVTFIILLLKNRLNSKLNKQLKSFKEREHYEKD